MAEQEEKTQTTAPSQNNGKVATQTPKPAAPAEQELLKYKANVDQSDVTSKWRVIDRKKKAVVKTGFHTELEALTFAKDHFEKAEKK